MMKQGGCVYEWVLNCGRLRKTSLIKFLEYVKPNSHIKKQQLLEVLQQVKSEHPKGIYLKQKLKALKNPPAETNREDTLSVKR